jgi:hypothetical protein
MAQPPHDTDRKAAEQQAQAGGKPGPQTHNVTVSATATALGTATASATGKVMRKVYTFRCSHKSDLIAVSLNPTGDNLPGRICTGEWVPHGEALVEHGGHIAGFVSRDLFRDLDRQGFHIASGVRAPVSLSQHDQTARAVGDALSAANTRTGFFTTGADA